MRASTIALVPLSAPGHAKSRLAGVLTSAERADLAARLADRVVRALHGAHLVDEIAIVGPPATFQPHWQSLGVMLIPTLSNDLNADLETGRQWALGHGAETLLVVHGDLALLDTAAVRELLGLLTPTPDHVVLVSDASRTGTNALAMRPADALPFAFGPDSFAAHTRLARSRGLSITTVADAPALTFDVDLPDDLRIVEERGIWTRRQAGRAEKEPA